MIKDMKKLDNDCTSSKDVQWTIKDVRDDSWTYILRKYKEQKENEKNRKKMKSRMGRNLWSSNQRSRSA